MAAFCATHGLHPSEGVIDWEGFTDAELRALSVEDLQSKVLVRGGIDKPSAARIIAKLNGLQNPKASQRPECLSTRGWGTC